MIRVQNTSVGPRGLFAGAEMVMLRPGESRDLDVTPANLRAAQATGWFSLEGEARAEPERDEQERHGVDLAKLDDDELRAFLKDRGISTDGRWGRERLLSEAEKVKA